MFRSIPQANKICSTKETQMNQQILISHIQSMRPQVDTRAPKQVEFLKNNRIKEAYKQEKQVEIDRENRNLIGKITNIMQQQQVGISNQNGTTNSSMGMKRSESSNTGTSSKKSLNKGHRKKELIKIIMENQLLLRRIQEQKSSYNVRSWEVERKEVEKQIANISDYPYKDFKPTKTLVQFWSNSRQIDSSLQKRDVTRRLEPLPSRAQGQREIDILDDNQITRQCISPKPNEKSGNFIKITDQCQTKQQDEQTQQQRPELLSLKQQELILQEVQQEEENQENPVINQEPNKQLTQQLANENQLEHHNNQDLYKERVDLQNDDGNKIEADNEEQQQLEANSLEDVDNPLQSENKIMEESKGMQTIEQNQ